MANEEFITQHPKSTTKVSCTVQSTFAAGGDGFAQINVQPVGSTYRLNVHFDLQPTANHADFSVDL